MSSALQFVDNYRHKGLRKKLVEKLAEKGISDQKVLQAIGKIPRHFFLDRAFEDWAYKDQAFPIDNKQTISQPFTVAYQTQLLELKGTDKVLEIGTGSGYQAAVLAELCQKVYTVERHQALYQKTRKLLQAIGYQRIRVYHHDGTEGFERYALYDKILVTAGTDEVPGPLLAQLKPGGCLVIPVGTPKNQVMQRIWKVAPGRYRTESYDAFVFVPLLKGTSDNGNG